MKAKFPGAKLWLSITQNMSGTGKRNKTAEFTFNEQEGRDLISYLRYCLGDLTLAFKEAGERRVRHKISRKKRGPVGPFVIANS